MLFGAIATVILVFVLGQWFRLLYRGALRKRKHRTFLLVMAALSCLSIPYGTILGIFTFMVLQRPAAKKLFEQGGTRNQPPRDHKQLLNGEKGVPPCSEPPDRRDSEGNAPWK